MFEISIIIPFKDEIKMLNSLIEAIKNQKTLLTFEIIILDSSDNDFQRELKIFDISFQWIKINPKEFNHGATRNFGLSFTDSKFIIFTVQDAVPTDEKWLGNLIRPLIENNLDAICGKQIVPHHPKKNPIEWSRPIDKPSLKIIDLESDEFLSLSKYEKHLLSSWDNVNAAYRRDSLNKLPFQNVMFGEDAQWAYDALLNNYKIAYTGFSSVEHYHHYDKDLAKRRFLAEYFIVNRIYNLHPSKPNLSIIKIISWLKILLKTNINFFSKCYWFKYNYNMHCAQMDAFQFWNETNSIAKIEEKLLTNIPQSRYNEANE